MDALKDFSRISPAVQSDLIRVYLSLFCILVASAFGAYLPVHWKIGGMITRLDGFILITSFLGTGMVFFCFSAVAMLARRRQFLYLGGLLSSGLVMLKWVSDSDFVSSHVKFESQLYFGLLIFVGYIVLDTQKIIEEAHLGDMDYVKHSLIFFIDFVGVFLRILIIKLNKSEDKEEKKKKKKKKDRRN